MFSNHSSEVVGFDSKLDTEKKIAENESQTVDLEYSEKTTATVSSSSSQTQTDNVSQNVAEYDCDKLAAWLKRIYPLVEEELRSSDSQGLFDEHRKEIDSENTSTRLLNVLEVPENDSKHKGKPRVSSLSWNCTGNMLAVAYSDDHESLCIHDVFVHIYTKNRDGNITDPPSHKLLVPACVTTLQFHPVEPSVLIGGCVTGQILLWTPTDKRKEFILNTFPGHTDSIQQIVWHKTLDLKDPFIVSAGLDAYIRIWNIDTHIPKLTLKERFKINLPHLINRPILKSERGVRCFSFSPFEPENFVVGVEGGTILRCSLNGAKPLAEVIDGVTTMDPVINKYEKHAGDVKCVQFSSHYKKLFLSCGSDGDVHIYNIDQENVTQTIFSEEILNNIYWLKSENKMIIACGVKGGLHLFSLQNGKIIYSPEKYDNTPLTVIGFNPKSFSTIAVGNSLGQVQLWNFPWKQISEDYIHTEI